MLASESFFRKTKKHFLYNIVPLSNIPSIIQHGILCYDRVFRLPHESIALSSVQDRRTKVSVVNGKPLHQYVNLYFDFHNPMLSRRRDQNDSICVLAVDYRVMDTDGCIVTDRNAASEIVRFLDPVTGMDEIDFDKVYATFWTHPGDEYEERNHKSIKCAEVLIPERVPYDYVTSACVVSNQVKGELSDLGFDKPVYIKPERFFY